MSRKDIQVAKRSHKAEKPIFPQIRKKSVSSCDVRLYKTNELQKASSKVNSKLEKQLGFFEGIDVNDLNTDEKIEKAFGKFWNKLTDGIEEEKPVSPEITKIDNKITDIQSRIKLNQMILRNANQRLRDINFDSEKHNIRKWRESIFTIRGDRCRRVQSVGDARAAMEETKDRKRDKTLFLKTSPGISNFNKTVESTLNMLEKVQSVENGNYERTFQELQKECEMNFFMSPPLVPHNSDEEI